jgi:hypothetical protein
MKHIVLRALLFGFFNIYSGDNFVERHITSLPPGAINSPCWFVNKSGEFPFENVDLKNHFGPFDYKPKITFLYSISRLVLHIPIVRILLAQPSPLFYVSDVLCSVLFAYYLSKYHPRESKSSHNRGLSFYRSNRDERVSYQSSKMETQAPGKVFYNLFLY